MTVEEKKAFVANGGILVDSFGDEIKLVDGKPMWVELTSGNMEELNPTILYAKDWIPVEEHILTRLLGFEEPILSHIHKAKAFIESIQAEEDFTKDPSAHTIEQSYSFGELVECYDDDGWRGTYAYLGEGPRGYIVSVTRPGDSPNARIDGVFTFKRIAPRKQQIPLDQALEILKKHFGKEVEII